jgi:NAD(P)-dependent dehydrogenase (short-subunit alcohol dehydrogenase family)
MAKIVRFHQLGGPEVLKIEEVVEKFGRLDILVNNAGVAVLGRSTIAAMTRPSSTACLPSMLAGSRPLSAPLRRFSVRVDGSFQLGRGLAQVRLGLASPTIARAKPPSPFTLVAGHAISARRESQST